MEDEKAIGIGIALVIAVMIASAMLNIFKQGSGFINKGLSQSTDLSKKFNDIDKQKYDGMSCMGDSVIEVISDYWDDATCEVVVCTLDGVNAVYNKQSSDGTYQVPFNEQLAGVPIADCKGRTFSTDPKTWALPSGVSAVTVANSDGTSCQAFDVATVSGVNVDPSTGKATGNAYLVDAAQLVQNPGGSNMILATQNGYNGMVTVGSGGYISNSASFTGSVQKDANGAIRRITFVQNN